MRENAKLLGIETKTQMYIQIAQRFTALQQSNDLKKSLYKHYNEKMNLDYSNFFFTTAYEKGAVLKKHKNIIPGYPETEISQLELLKPTMDIIEAVMQLTKK